MVTSSGVRLSSHPRRACAVALVIGLALALITPAVHADVTGDAPNGTKAKAALCRGKTKKAAIKAIKATYETAFNAGPETPIDERVDLIEDADTDPELRAVLDVALSQAGDQVSQLSATIKKVRCKSKRRANVKYDVLGVLPTKGTAVLIDGTWKVSKREVCELLSFIDPTVTTAAPCAS